MRAEAGVPPLICVAKTRALSVGDCARPRPVAAIVSVPVLLPLWMRLAIVVVLGAALPLVIVRVPPPASVMAPRL